VVDATKLLEWVNGHPGYGWVPLLIACILLLLAYEVAKSLLPNLVKALVGGLGSMTRARQVRFKAERAIRRFCIASRNVSWVGSLPALATFDFNVPLTEVFIPPRLQVSRNGGTGWAIGLQEFLSANRLACISGAPGSGKSTLLSITAIAFAQEKADVALGINEARLPLCFDCKDFPASDQLPPAPELFAALFEKHGVHIEAEHLRRLLDEGRCAVLLDGLDEVASAAQRRLLLDWLVGLSAAYSENNRILITCRDAEWQGGSLPHIARARVLPFSLKEARAFVSKWRGRMLAASFGDASASARECRFETLTEELDGDFEFLYANPMLLTLATVLLSIDVPLPRKRSHVLNAFVLSMLGDWGSLKGRSGGARNVQPTFTALRRLALQCVEDVQTRGLIRANDPRLGAILGDEAAADRSPVAWLESTSASSGLLQPLGDDTWIFTNRRILEFLAASELASQPAKWRAYWEDPTWKDILMFLPELVADKMRHLQWVEAQGPPVTDMHALFLLNSALECEDGSPTMANAVLEKVRAYIFERCSSGAPIDDDLARRYMRTDHAVFMPRFEHELTSIAESPANGGLIFAALRAGYAPATRQVGAKFETLNATVQRKIVEELATFRPVVQTTLLPSLLRANLGRELHKALSRCGAETLDELIALARQYGNSKIREEALAAIAEFAHPSAITFLTEMLGDGELDQSARFALERNLAVIGTGISEADLGAMLSRPGRFYETSLKRSFDLVLSVISIVMFLPLLIGVPLLLKVTSRGPIVQRTLCVGREGRLFNRLRFRTIYDVTEDLHVIQQSTRSDARVTPLGSILRRTYLDELPSLLVVVRGDMAMVGPRPLPPNIMQARYQHGYNLAVQVRARLRPGLFSLTRLEFGESGSISSERETARDLHYAANCCFTLDLKILALSVSKPLFDPSAY
jgi:lipopolysaccharide/colanic/teichoic acid biosynthesis glycosyltransferase